MHITTVADLDNRDLSEDYIRMASLLENRDLTHQVSIHYLYADDAGPAPPPTPPPPGTLYACQATYVLTVRPLIVTVFNQ